MDTRKFQVSEVVEARADQMGRGRHSMYQDRL